jgi:hypothetical protein
MIEGVDLCLEFGQRLSDELAKVAAPRRVERGPLSDSSRCGTPWAATALSCTLIGPWSSPEASRAARTCMARALTSSVNFEGLDLGRRDRGSRTAAGPSVLARLRSS